jgi:predicted SPOUT superfamily RNA methylase MTH1
VATARPAPQREVRADEQRLQQGTEMARSPQRACVRHSRRSCQETAEALDNGGRHRAPCAGQFSSQPTAAVAVALGHRQLHRPRHGPGREPEVRGFHASDALSVIEEFPRQVACPH